MRQRLIGLADCCKPSLLSQINTGEVRAHARGSPSVKMAKNNQEGRINQCFYFDKASGKRLYIQIQGGGVPDRNYKIQFNQ